jgi:hypothetical protein
MDKLGVDEVANLVTVSEAALHDEHPYISAFRQRRSSKESLSPQEARYGAYWPTLNPNVARCLSFAPQHLFECAEFCSNAFQELYLQWDAFSADLLTAAPSDVSHLDYGDFSEAEKLQYHAAIRLKQLSSHIYSSYTAAGAGAVKQVYHHVFEQLFSHYFPVRSLQYVLNLVNSHLNGFYGCLEPSGAVRQTFQRI